MQQSAVARKAFSQEVFAPLAEEKCPHLISKWTRCKNVIGKLPEEAFGAEQRLWLAKLISEHMDYGSLALQVADGLVTSREMLSEGLQREMYFEFRDAIDEADI